MGIPWADVFNVLIHISRIYSYILAYIFLNNNVGLTKLFHLSFLWFGDPWLFQKSSIAGSTLEQSIKVNKQVRIQDLVKGGPRF